MLVRGVDLAVREFGEGPAFIWSHALLGSMEQEDAGGILAWPKLAQTVRLVRYDARGHGRSEATLDPDDYRWSEMARDLWSLADVLGAERALLGGVSMGCATSLHAAVAAPERVLGLVLVGAPTSWSTRPRQARLYRVSAKMIEKLGLAPFRWMGALATFRTGSALAEMQRSVMQGLAHADSRTVVSALRGAAASDLPEPARLAMLKVPVLILAWRGDPSHPVSSAERLAELLPDAELCIAGSSDEIRAWPQRVDRYLAERVSSRDASTPPV